MVTAMAPLGRLDRETVAALAGLADEVRVSRWRSLTVRDVAEAEVAPLQRSLEELGLVVAPDTGWTRLSACPGVGGCAKARIDVRSAARGVPACAPPAPAPSTGRRASGAAASRATPPSRSLPRPTASS